jgi:hypothetical protein
VEDVLERFLFDFPEQPSSNTTSSSSNVTQITPTKAPDYRSPEAIAREEDYSRKMAEAIARSNKIQDELEEIKNKLNRASSTIVNPEERFMFLVYHAYT